MEVWGSVQNEPYAWPLGTQESFLEQWIYSVFPQEEKHGNLSKQILRSLYSKACKLSSNVLNICFYSMCMCTHRVTDPAFQRSFLPREYREHFFSFSTTTTKKRFEKSFLVYLYDLWEQLNNYTIQYFKCSILCKILVFIFKPRWGWWDGSEGYV